MQDQNQNTPNNVPTAVPAIGSRPAGVPSAKPAVNSTSKEVKAAPAKAGGSRLANAKSGTTPQNDFIRRIIDKIKSSENILVALSRDPSVDEMAAAIGLTMFLDGLQKHTTAIYSGQTPDTLQFLQPEGTFETNTDSLQDFIIALNKEKADHLRYKLDGDFVKVYITPYKTVLTENDLEFSHGDFNVDLVLALGVPTAEDLDEALSEHGRIMHDATTVDITCDAPGRFGEIEWSDPGASSVSEMVTKLVFAMQGQDETVDKEIATALLTGIVAATGRFSNDRTNSETMQLASKLMSMGADQQLISAHVMDNDPDVSTQEIPMPKVEPNKSEDNLLVGKDYGNYTTELKSTVVPADVPTAGGIQQATLANQAKAAMANVQNNQTAVPASSTENTATVGAVGANPNFVAPPPAPAPVVEEPKNYAQMLEQALAEPTPAEVSINTAVPDMQQYGQMQYDQAMQAPVQMTPEQMAQAQAMGQVQPMPAAQPVVTPTPAVEAVPDPNTVVLPPPPAPTVDAGMMPPVLPEVQVPADLAAQQAAEQAQAMATQAAQAQQAQPGAFQIPGM